MACTPDKIKSIDRSRETLKLAIRITDLWFVGTPNKSEQAEMVIVDSDVWSFLFFLVAGLLTILRLREKNMTSIYLFITSMSCSEVFPYTFSCNTKKSLQIKYFTFPIEV